MTTFEFQFSNLLQPTGWAKTSPLSPLHLIAHVFKTPEPVCVIFGTLKRRFRYETSLNPYLIEFITQSGATSRKSATRIKHSSSIIGMSALSRTSLVRRLLDNSHATGDFACLVFFFCHLLMFSCVCT